MNTNTRRFPFGKNWQAFLDYVGEIHIQKAEESLRMMLDVRDLKGKTFLDAGCGSGLFSLAASRLGAAKIVSFDYDAASVACTREVKNRFAPAAENWLVEQGDALDIDYVKQLGTFDVVYSWGVLHHTGNMWKGLENILYPVSMNGKLFIAIYNDQGWASYAWRWIKKTYNHLPGYLRWLVLFPAMIRLWGPRTVVDVLRGKPFETWKTYSRNRGMSAWHDVLDWVGGYPFEVARPDEIFDFYFQRGLTLTRLKTVGGKVGCNEFVFTKIQ